MRPRHIGLIAGGFFAVAMSIVGFPELVNSRQGASCQSGTGVASICGPFKLTRGDG